MRPLNFNSALLELAGVELPGFSQPDIQIRFIAQDATRGGLHLGFELLGCPDQSRASLAFSLASGDLTSG